MIFVANHALHTDSAITLGFHIGAHRRGGDDGERYMWS
jgi:hypothetical protein